MKVLQFGGHVQFGHDAPDITVIAVQRRRQLLDQMVARHHHVVAVPFGIVIALSLKHQLRDRRWRRKHAKKMRIMQIAKMKKLKVSEFGKSTMFINVGKNGNRERER